MLGGDASIDVKDSVEDTAPRVLTLRVRAAECTQPWQVIACAKQAPASSASEPLSLRRTSRPPRTPSVAPTLRHDRPTRRQYPTRRPRARQPKRLDRAGRYDQVHRGEKVSQLAPGRSRTAARKCETRGSAPAGRRRAGPSPTSTSDASVCCSIVVQARSRTSTSFSRANRPMKATSGVCAGAPGRPRERRVGTPARVEVIEIDAERDALDAPRAMLLQVVHHEPRGDDRDLETPG